MDIKGRTCTIYPLDLSAALIPPGYDPGIFEAVYQENLTKKLIKAGLVARYAAPGVADGELIVRGTLVRIEKGSRWMSVFFLFGMLGGLLSMLAGGAIFEVNTTIGDAHVPFAQLNAVGKYSVVMPWGKNESGMKNAARYAAQATTSRLLKALKAR